MLDQDRDISGIGVQAFNGSTQLTVTKGVTALLEQDVTVTIPAIAFMLTFHMTSGGAPAGIYTFNVPTTTAGTTRTTTTDGFTD